MIADHIRTVYFDLGGTLVHPVHVGRVYAGVARRLGMIRDEQTLLERFKAAFRRQEEVDRFNDWRTDEARELQRWRAIVADTLGPISDFEQAFAELYDFYSHAAGWTLDPGVPAVLEDLRRRGLRVGVASNYDHRARRVLDEIPALASIDLRIISSEVGWRKPAAAFFSAMCGACGNAPSQVLLVGDDLESDYRGALANGLNAILLERGEREPKERVVRIASLQELLG